MRLLGLASGESQRGTPAGEGSKPNYRWGLVGFDGSGKQVNAVFFGRAYLAVSPSADSRSKDEKELIDELRALVDTLLRQDGFYLEDRRQIFGCG